MKEPAPNETEWISDIITAFAKFINSEGGKDLAQKISESFKESRSHKENILEKQISFSKHLQRWDIVQILVLFAGLILAGIFLHINSEVIAGLLGAIIGNALPKFNLFGQQERHR